MEKTKKITLTTTQIILLSFLAVILLGSGLLALPISASDGRAVAYVDALFTARENTLNKLADNLAEKAIRLGKKIKLEPMNPYERKVIHSVLQTHPKVTTRSEGVEPNRRVIIELKK